MFRMPFLSSLSYLMIIICPIWWGLVGWGVYPGSWIKWLLTLHCIGEQCPICIRGISICLSTDPICQLQVITGGKSIANTQSQIQNLVNQIHLFLYLFVYPQTPIWQSAAASQNRWKLNSPYIENLVWYLYQIHIPKYKIRYTKYPKKYFEIFVCLPADTDLAIRQLCVITGEEAELGEK